MGAPRNDGKLGRMRGDDIASGPEMMGMILPGREEGEGCLGRSLEMGTMNSPMGLEEEHKQGKSRTCGWRDRQGPDLKDL